MSTMMERLLRGEDMVRDKDAFIEDVNANSMGDISETTEPTVIKDDEATEVMGDVEGLRLQRTSRGWEGIDEAGVTRTLYGRYDDRVGLFLFDSGGTLQVAQEEGGTTLYNTDGTTSLILRDGSLLAYTAAGANSVKIEGGSLVVYEGDIRMAQGSSLIKLGLNDDGVTGMAGPHGLQAYDDAAATTGMGILYRSSQDAFRFENLSNNVDLFNVYLNGEVRIPTTNGFLSAANPGSAMYRLVGSGGQVISATTTARLVFTGTDFSHVSFLSDETSTSSIQVPWTGKYLVHASLTQTNLASGQSLLIDIRKNGSSGSAPRLFYFRGAGSGQHESGATVIEANAGDFISLWGTNNAASSVTLGAGINEFRWGVQWLGR